MTTPGIEGVMAAAMDGEINRRKVASMTPGAGALMALPQPPAGPGVGLSDITGLDVQGEGYDVPPPVGPAVTAAYGPDRPQYADAVVAGYSHPLNLAQPALRHVHDLGDGTLFVEGRSAGADPFTVVSPSARPSLLARLLGRLRRH